MIAGMPAAVTVPLPLATVQVSPAGCVATVTLYDVPVGKVPGNEKAPLAATGSRTCPSLRVTLVPAASPETDPASDWVVAQITETVLTGSSF